MFEIVFEDKDILVVNKPGGLVVNRAETVKEETLQDQVADYLGLNGLGIGGRAGIVHRLDRETSGVLIVAKGQEAFENLQEQFKNRQVSKTYAALVHNLLKEDSGSIEGKIRRVGYFGKFGLSKNREEGKEARTDFLVERRLKLKISFLNQYINKGSFTKNTANYLGRQAVFYTYLKLFPKSGRTHQIRVHIKSIGNPVVSDLIYCPRKLLGFDLLWCPRLFLHAESLEFAHPKTKKRVLYSCDLPNELKNAILNLEDI